MDIQWEEFWWNNITGPHVVVSNVADALLENKMVVLKVPSDLPWRHSMRSAIHTSFQEKSDFRDVIIEPIDIFDDNPEKKEPGRFILDRFASPTIRKGYRERSRTSIQEYISARNVTKNRVIWVKGLDGKDAEKWVKFCRGFSERSVDEGLFVLEIHDDIPITDTRLLKVIDFSECVSSYDVQLFNSFILDNQNLYPDNWKKYIAVCVAAICDIDAEVSEQMLRSMDFRTESAIDGVRRISEMPDFSSRGANSSSKHILWCCRNGRISEIEYRIWMAQIQVLFPIIELERVALIHKYETEIQNILNHEEITQYGVVLHDAIDVELGTLCYLMGRRGNHGNYSFYIPNEADRNRIRFLHDCRNKLAHAICCLPAQVRELLG